MKFKLRPSALILLFISAAFFLAVVVPSWRAELRSYILKPHRKILATVTAEIPSFFNNMKILKISTNKGLFLEIYASNLPYTFPLLQRILLPDRRDGYFHFQGKATNLAIDDLDGDQIPEIIAPSFNDSLAAHLNIYRFNQKIKQFELQSQ